MFIPEGDRLEEISRNVQSHVDLFIGAIQDCYRSDPVALG